MLMGTNMHNAVAIIGITLAHAQMDALLSYNKHISIPYRLLVTLCAFMPNEKVQWQFL